MAATAGTILVSGQAVVLVNARLVIVSMTARAVWLVAWRRPGNNFGVRAVAVSALRISRVIHRLITETHMPVVRRSPRIGVVTQTAVLGRIEVSGIRPRCVRSVVTAGTGTQYLIVVHRSYRCPGIAAMTIFTNVGCRYMQRTFARRIRAVVAADTIVDDVCVIKVGGQPGDSCMAVVAVFAARNMRRMFADCCYAIVTGPTAAQYLGMVHRYSRHPGIRAVAIFADIGSQCVRRVFAGCSNAVMAVTATAGDVGVIEISG